MIYYDYFAEEYVAETEVNAPPERYVAYVKGEEGIYTERYSVMVHQEQGRALYALRHAKDIKRKREGLKTTKYEDVLKQYPELVSAIEQTLNRPAWNER